MMKFALGALSVTVLVLSTLPAHAVVSAQGDDWLPEVVDSALLSGPIVASGQVLSDSGKPYEAGLPVVLRLWPGEDVLGPLKVGDGVKVTPVAKALTGADGSFELRIDSPANVSRIAGEGEYVDLEIVVSTPDGLAPYSFSLSTSELMGDSSVEAPENRAHHGSLMDLVLEPISGTDSSVSDRSSQGVPDGAVSDPATDGSSDFVGKLYCEWVVVQNLGNREVTVGSAYMTASGVTNDFQFNSGATMTLGVGYSGTGQNVGFTQAGTSTRTTNGTVDYPSHTGTNNHRIFKTYYQYATFRERCQTSATSGWYFVNNWETRPQTWAAGAPYGTSASAPATPSGYCTPFPAAAVFTKSATAAVTWSSGTSVSAYIGINLSSQSGWSSAVKNVWTFNVAGRALCGTDAAIGGNARRLVARTA